MDTLLIGTEFPDFDVASLPEIPEGFVDASWHNDACPCFVSQELGLVIWVDYPKAEDREFPESPRFALKGNEPHIFFGAHEDFAAILAEIERLPRILAETRGDLTDDAVQGWLAFWANERPAAERGEDYVHGWRLAWRRAYAMGASDCRTNFERDFAQFSAPWESWGDGWNDETHGLIPAREPEPPTTDEGMMALGEEALNAACRLIQERLGVTDGGFAAEVFSDNEVRGALVRYIVSERAMQLASQEAGQ